MENTKPLFTCPMHPEVLRNEMGNCPNCEMKLIAVDEARMKELHDPHDHGSSAHLHPSGEAPGEYYCPMRCEGDKVYSAPGRCPVCGMHLVPGNRVHLT